jgi:hypothetical protein
VRYLLPLAALMVGLAFGAYALDPSMTHEITPSDTAAVRTFSPESHLFAQAAHDVPVISEPPIVSSTSDRPSWRPVVTAVGESQDRLSSVQPEDEYARVELVRDLQRELKRVGCYDGSTDGQWTTRTKRAMGVFTDRVNAVLPLGQPDYVMLSLVRGQHSEVCGKTCPSGQALADDRCMPSAILAHRDKSSPNDAKMISASSAPISANTATPSGPAFEGRMSMGGPMPDATAAIPPQAPSTEDASDKRSSVQRQVRSIDDLFIHPLNPL